jgi:hypothetical protein
MTFFAVNDALHVDPQSVQGVIFVFLALAIGHAVADFPLQGAFLAKAKNRHSDISNYFGKSAPSGVWLHAMTAHSLIHAGAVWLITGSAVLAVIELVAHWVIDYVKCEGWIGFNTDQLLHYVCKIIYAMLIYLGVTWI